MQFEFDPAKSLANLAKHGIDFEQAQALWQDQDYLKPSPNAGRAPAWMVGTLDAEAARLGITRQAVIKTWIAERIDERAS